MSRRLLVFLLSELRIVRLVCKNMAGGQKCGAVAEMTIEQMNNPNEQYCKICKARFSDPNNTNPIHGFAHAVLSMQQHSNTNAVDLEFIFPDNNSETSKS